MRRTTGGRVGAPRWIYAGSPVAEGSSPRNVELEEQGVEEEVARGRGGWGVDVWGGEGAFSKHEKLILTDDIFKNVFFSPHLWFVKLILI